jgi:hypothetical protein
MVGNCKVDFLLKKNTDWDRTNFGIELLSASFFGVVAKTGVNDIFLFRSETISVDGLLCSDVSSITKTFPVAGIYDY